MTANHSSGANKQTNKQTHLLVRVDDVAHLCLPQKLRVLQVPLQHHALLVHAVRLGRQRSPERARGRNLRARARCRSARWISRRLRPSRSIRSVSEALSAAPTRGLEANRLLAAARRRACASVSLNRCDGGISVGDVFGADARRAPPASKLPSPSEAFEQGLGRGY